MPIATTDMALFTKSYAGDFEHCVRLCASIDRHMANVPHYLVVDRVDAPLFSQLVRGRRNLLISENYLPELFQISVLGRRLWLTPYGPPVRGWIQQQLAKLAVIATLPEKAVVLVDSDVVFVRPLPLEAVLQGGRTRLYRVPGEGQSPKHKIWHRVAARLLGLQPRDYFGADYINTVIAWRPDVVRALLPHIRRSTRLPWRMALTWRFRFSECLLYGIFADHVPGPQSDLLFADEMSLCHCCWGYDLDSPEGRAAFLRDLEPQHAAVLIQSNLNLANDVRNNLFCAFEVKVHGETAQ